MNFGFFDDRNREYVITTPKTPLPWINYLGCNDFFSLISNTCGGYSFYKDAKLLRLTRYRYNNVPADTNGKYFYLKDGDTIWNPGWQPSKTPLDFYECRHGIGYSRFLSSKNGLSASVLTFVPMNDSCEISQIKLTNESGAEKNITLFSYVEWCLWNADDDMKKTTQVIVNRSDIPICATYLRDLMCMDKREEWMEWVDDKLHKYYDTLRSEMMSVPYYQQRALDLLTGKIQIGATSDSGLRKDKTDEEGKSEN